MNRRQRHPLVIALIAAALFVAGLYLSVTEFGAEDRTPSITIPVQIEVAATPTP